MRGKSLISLPEAGIVVILFSLVLLFQAINPSFLSLPNIAGMLRAMAYPGIAAVGMALCLMAGVIDLSVGATVGLASVIFGIASRDWGWSFIASGALAVTAGLLVGILNGVVITKLRVTPFIMTICSMYMVRGIASWLCNGYTVYPLPLGFSEVGVHETLGVSWAFAIMIGLMILGTIALNTTVWGLTVRAVGSDKEAAACTEVNVNHVHRSVYVITGGVAALSGVLVSLILNAGQFSAGTGWELVAIAACAIGGVSLFGHDGSFFGLFCGLLTLQVIQNGIVIIGINPYTQIVVVGGILLISMVLEVRRRRWLNLDSI